MEDNYPITYNRSIAYSTTPQASMTNLHSSSPNHSSSSLAVNNHHNRVRRKSSPLAFPASSSAYYQNAKKSRRGTLQYHTNSIVTTSTKTGNKQREGKSNSGCITLKQGVLTMIASWLLISLLALIKVFPVADQSADGEQVDYERVVGGVLMYLCIYISFKFWMLVFGVISLVGKRWQTLRLFTAMFTIWDTVLTLANGSVYIWFIQTTGRLPISRGVEAYGTCASLSGCDSLLELDETYRVNYQSLVTTLTIVAMIYQLVTAYYLQLHYRSRRIVVAQSKAPRHGHSITMMARGQVKVDLPQRMERSLSAPTRSSHGPQSGEFLDVELQ